VNGDEKNPPYTADSAVFHDDCSSTELHLLGRAISLQGFHPQICQRKSGSHHQCSRKIQTQSFEMDVHSYKGSFSCTLPITIDEKATKGKIQFPIEVACQLCDGSMCLPPTTISLPFAVIVQ